MYVMLEAHDAVLLNPGSNVQTWCSLYIFRTSRNRAFAESTSTGNCKTRPSGDGEGCVGGREGVSQCSLRARKKTMLVNACQRIRVRIRIRDPYLEASGSRKPVAWRIHREGALVVMNCPKNSVRGSRRAVRARESMNDAVAMSPFFHVSRQKEIVLTRLILGRRERSSRGVSSGELVCLLLDRRASLFRATPLDPRVMGNKSSSPMTPPCGGAVTAHPTTPVLTRRDANSLHQLYGHDPELLQLMTASEALRDLAKGARDACVTHFHDAMQASKKEHAFGVRLVAMSERMDSLGACLLEQTNGNALDTIGVLMETTGSDDDDGKETGEQAEEETEAPPEIGTSNESARRVLDVDRLSRKLGDAYVATAVARERVYGRLLDNMKKLARDLEKAHQVKLQRHAP